MHAYIPQCVFLFLPTVHGGWCASHAFGALRFCFLLCLNRSLSFSNRELPGSFSQITSYECTMIYSAFSLWVNTLGYF